MDSAIETFSLKASLSDIRLAAENCQLCALLLHALKRHRNNNDSIVDIVRTGAGLQIGQGGARILRFCVDLKYSADSSNNTPISFPVLPEAENPARFALLREWLRWCDKSHDCNMHRGEFNTALPTRLLYVGDPVRPDYDPGVLRLYCPEQNDRIKYVALSHCWGKLSNENKRQFCTTDDNIEARRRGFNFSDLPKTFRDAVRVTRELGIQYLWIDSLCIIQQNMEDWNHEAKRMEEVFSSAYCTIAATSAVDSNAGFLDRKGSSECVPVQNASGKQFYICADIDDFDKDVEKGRLNTRAWVIQERVLAQRTIHFCANQTYWECGEGVYCENLTRLQSTLRKKFFMLDPNFPNRLLRSGNQRIAEFTHFLLEDYSKRDLTEKTDRCVAISGLEARIADALKCQSRYGIFQKHLHRNLLWQASNNKMERIAYNNRHVPSWSWMAYSGGMQFIPIPFGKVCWVDTLWFDEECKLALITDVGEFRDCTTEPDGKNYAVLDCSRTKRGWIQYDVEEGEDLCKERCVVVGRKRGNNVEYYILVVRPTSVDGEFKRVGVGLVQSDYVMRQRLNVRVV